MVDRDIAGRGIADERVVDAMASVPRHRFVPRGGLRHAYSDQPLPIGSGQTISQPYIVAAMAQAAQISATDRVLEVGTGSGYGAAVLGRLAREVWTIERHADLATRARRTLRELGYDNVHVVVGDGTLGWPDAAPYDAIVVTAAGPSIPAALREQLADGGRIVIPVGPDVRNQRLVREVRHGSELVAEKLAPVRFVPLVGEQGWPGGEG